MAATPPPRGFRKVGPVTPAETKQRKTATTKREKFEANNPERGTTLQDQQFASHGIVQSPRDVGMSHREAYRAYGLNEHQASPHVLGQTELPGMKSVMEARQHGVMSTTASPAMQSRTLPDLAPAPRRWEEMHPEEQKKTLRMASRFGVTPASMEQNLGAQVDQAHMRAAQHGMTPYASHFYSGDDPSRPFETSPHLRGATSVYTTQSGVRKTVARSDAPNMQPRERLMNSAQELGVDFGTHVMANAMTSPKAKFRHRNSSTGEVSYPNDEAASEAVAHGQIGTKPEDYQKPRGLVVMTGNIRRAMGAVDQRINQGHALEEVTNPGGSKPFGPKTGPYNNSFMDPHGSSQFFVSDVHSGGGGMAPHLSHSAPFKKDEEGSYIYSAGGKHRRDSSERENYLAIPGIHSLHDHVARKVGADRGISSTSALQAAQWGEEQLQRGEHGGGGSARKQQLVSASDAYGKSEEPQHVRGQQAMFGANPPEARNPERVVSISPARRSIFDETEEPTGQDRVRAEYAIAARQKSVARKRRSA